MMHRAADKNHSGSSQNIVLLMNVIMTLQWISLIMQDDVHSIYLLVRMKRNTRSEELLMKTVEVELLITTLLVRINETVNSFPCK